MDEETPSMTLKQKLDLSLSIASILSLSVIVFIRRRIGFRTLDSGWYLAVALLVYILAVFNPEPDSPFPDLMAWYALAIVVLGAFHRLLAWIQIQRGTPSHSYSSGISIFELRWFPRFVRVWRLTNRFVDPAFTLMVGWYIRHDLSVALGNWLIFTSVCLAFYELFVQRSITNLVLDLSDGLTVAESQGATVKRLRQAQASPSAVHSDGEAISTGLGKDIAGKVKERRKER